MDGKDYLIIFFIVVCLLQIRYIEKIEKRKGDK